MPWRPRVFASPSWSRAVAGGAFLAVTGLLAARTLRLLNVPGDPAMDATRWALCDFRDAVYYPAVSLLDGGNPYGTSFSSTYPVASALAPYLPLILLVHLPFALMPYTVAEGVHFVLTLGLTLVLAALALELAGLKRTGARVLGLGALLLLSRPGHWNLVLGQPTLPVAIGAYLALRWSDERPGLASVGLAMAFGKPSFGLPLAVVMLARRDLRVVVTGMAIAAGVSAAVVVALVVRAGLGPFLDDVRGGFMLWATALDPFANTVAFYGAIDAVVLLSRPMGRELELGEQLVVATVVLAIAGLAIRRLAARPEPEARVRSLSIGVLAVLLAVHHQAYDCLLLAPTGVAVATGPGRLEPAGRAGLRLVLLALLIVPSLNYLASNTAIAGLGITHTWAFALCSADGAALSAALLLASGAALAERRPG